MKIDDRIYGVNEITEDCVLDLLNSNAILRLGKINQYGAIYQVYPQFFTTRMEHSIGVMLLLKKLGASLEEQIAGLIHDVPHTAFSHVIDYIFGDQNMEFSYHEVIQREVLERSDIPDILHKHGLDSKKIFNIDSFSLLERSLPDLCADRADYILRDLVTYNLLDVQTARNIAESLCVHSEQIAVFDENMAFVMAEKSIEANRKIWSSPYQIYLARKLADGIKMALERGYIDLVDLHGTDNKLYRKLNKISDHDIKDSLSALTKKIVVSLDENDYEIRVHTKLRVIDPPVVLNGKLTRLSKINDKFAKIKEEYANFHQKGFPLNIRKRDEGEIIKNYE